MDCRPKTVFLRNPLMPDVLPDDAHTIYYTGSLGLLSIPIMVSKYWYEKAKAEGLFKE